MPSTTWNKETYPGSSVEYDNPNLTYDATDEFEESGTPRYDQIGETTSWTEESQ